MRPALWLLMAAGCTYSPFPLDGNQATCDFTWTASPGSIQGDNVLLFAAEQNSEATIAVSNCEATWVRESSYGCTKSAPPCCDPATDGRLICQVPAVPHPVITIPVQVELTTSSGLERVDKTITVLPTPESASWFVDSELGLAAAGTPSEPTTLTDALTRTANRSGTSGIYIRGSAAEISQPLDLAGVFLGGGLGKDWSISSCRCPGFNAASWQEELRLAWHPDDCHASRLEITAVDEFSGSSLVEMRLEPGAPPSGIQGLYLHHDRSGLDTLASITLVGDGRLGTVDVFVVDSDFHGESQPVAGLVVNEDGSGTLALDLELRGAGIYLDDVASDAKGVKLAAPLGDSWIDEACLYVESLQDADAISWVGEGGGQLVVTSSSVAVAANGKVRGIYAGDHATSLDVRHSRLFASGGKGATGVESRASAKLQVNEIHVSSSSQQVTSGYLSGIEISAASANIEGNRLCAHGAAPTVAQVSVTSADETTIFGNSFQVPACGTPSVAGGVVSQVIISGGEVVVAKNLWCPPWQSEGAVALELVGLTGVVEKNQISGSPCDEPGNPDGRSARAMRFKDVTGLVVQRNWVAPISSAEVESQWVFDVTQSTHLTVHANAIVAHNGVFAPGGSGAANFAFNTVLFDESAWIEEDVIINMIGLGSIVGNVHHNVLLKPAQLESDLGWPATFTRNVLVVSSLGTDAMIPTTGENSGHVSSLTFLCDSRPWHFDPHLTQEFDALQGDLGDSPPADIDDDPRPAGSHWGADANPVSCGRLAPPPSAAD
jgi:hypothetical protein